MSTTLDPRFPAPDTGADPAPILHQLATEYCFAYLLADRESRVAAVVDPRADQVERYLEELRERGLKLVLVLETHTHADHLSGAAELRRLTGAEVVVSRAAESQVATRKVKDGDRLALGGLGIEVLASPGHTDDSVSYRFGDALLTGDALLVGGAGRTDFQNGSPEDLFQTLHRRFQGLPDTVTVYPGHDYAGHTHTTLGHERAKNPLFAFADAQEMARAMRAVGQPKPADMDSILAANRRGLRAPKAIHPGELEARLAGAHPPLLVDVRMAGEYGEAHIAGSLLIPLDELDRRKGEIPQGRELVLVCRTGSRARLAAARLEPLAPRVLEGGIAAWQAMDLAVVLGAKHMSVERQVRIIAGLMAGLGGLLAIFVSPWFGILPAFIGSGLVYAGITDRCGMTMFLSWLPYNRAAASAAAAAGGTCAAVVAGCAVSLPAQGVLPQGKRKS